ncbi:MULTISPECIES: type III secretion system export apparatus subunit SctS [unclassified Burkholderia]|uniref:type III secretion system export apparatus subunit SctS n=1 Tax=unclassified Burkholderia TaxID=2613784 RepID=UPI00075E9BBB|nr:MULTISPECIES: type III secretion system export apparatus subunit SctS [unclassified Burkholderia]KUY50682.1 type III secretion apparatus protein [Burkholderia sp. RF2-non_BP3]KUY81455.1 type III secretion apparatus protein [Burkholderia sp. RF4-BP95]KUY96703.1 type III secretion apparatus protein [Burkholderia sp. RF7-non_BP4]KUZ02918.1 type III secretion apparatus protein [Burkholderia sp. RF7-non_BP1]
MGELSYIGSKAIVLVILLCAVPVAVATIVGLIVGLFQTVTQIQDQTLPFGIKLLAVFGSLLLLSNWISAKLIAFAIEAVTIGLK